MELGLESRLVSEFMCLTNFFIFFQTCTHIRAGNDAEDKGEWVLNVASFVVFRLEVF